MSDHHPKAFLAMPVFKIDLHAHCHVDTQDQLVYTPQDMVDRAVELGLQAFAITPHGRVFHDPESIAYAAKRGILLIPGVEKLVEGVEVLLLNVQPEEIPEPFSFKDLRRLREARRSRGDFLAVAPHPFYPRQTCIGSRMDEVADLLDAVEHAHLYTFFWNPNRKAIRWCRRNHKPLVANSDTHLFEQFGCQYTEVVAEALTIPALFEAIRQGKVRAVTPRPGLSHLINFAVRVSVFQNIARTIRAFFRH